jgi:hypothetical protein
MSERKLPVTGQVSERLMRELSALKGGSLQGVYSQVELGRRGLIDVRYAPIASKSAAQRNRAMGQ